MATKSKKPAVTKKDEPVYMGKCYAVKIIALGHELCFSDRLVDIKKKDVYFTRDGITEKCDISRRNTFATPRKALLAFSEFLSRHDDFEYVDIIMSEHNEYIV